MKAVRASYRDPGNGVYSDEAGQRFFRRLAYPPETYNSLLFFPQVLGKTHGDMHEVERIPFMNYFHEWTFSQCRDSALFYLDRLEALSNEGWCFSDAHPTNITYTGNGRFLFMDHGSLVREDGRGWLALQQFIKKYAYPLMWMANLPCRPPQSLATLINDDSWQLLYRPPFPKSLSPGYHVIRSTLLLSSRRSLKDTGTKPIRSGPRPGYSIAFLRDFIRSLTVRRPRTRWGDYYERTILDEGYLERKLSLVGRLVAKVSDGLTTAADFGASSGRVAASLSERFKHISFIALESDQSAAESLYANSKSHCIIPIHSNILQLTPALGFDGSCPSLDERLRAVSGLNLALGIVHHMMHAENLPFERIVRFFKDRSVPGAFLVIEHVGPGDPRYRLIRNPNYPHPEDRASFEEALRAHYRIIEKEEVREERTIYLAEAH